MNFTAIYTIMMFNQSGDAPIQSVFFRNGPTSPTSFLPERIYMYTHSITSIKQAARRVLNQNIFRCILATFLSGTFVSLVFSFLLDGTMQLENAFDREAFYQAIASAGTPQDIYLYIRSGIASLINSIGYDAYSQMLRKFLLAMALSFVLQFLYRLLVVLPFEVGNCRFYSEAHYTEPKYRLLVCSFTADYFNVIKILFLRQLKVLLWSLLFIVPGIIKAYDTFMIPYLLADNPKISRKEAFETSRCMMYGNKLNVLVLNLSFLGWFLLSVLTQGIVYLFFAGPYYDAARTNMALRIKAEYRNRNQVPA